MCEDKILKNYQLELKTFGKKIKPLSASFEKLSLEYDKCPTPEEKQKIKLQLDAGYKAWKAENDKFEKKILSFKPLPKPSKEFEKKAKKLYESMTEFKLNKNLKLKIEPKIGSKGLKLPTPKLIYTF